MTKRILSIISLALVLVLAIIACAGCTMWDGVKDKINAVIAQDGNGNEMIAGVTYDMPEEMMFTGLKMAGNENTGVTITATINPESAISLVDWSLSWKNTSDVWTNGKNPSDYVSLTPTSSGSLTATVSMLQRFASKILIKCTARADNSKYATCDVGCYNRLANTAEFQHGYNDGVDHYLKYGDAYSGSDANWASSHISNVPPIRPGSWQLVAQQMSAMSLRYVEDGNYGAYTTLSNSTVRNISITPTAELAQQLANVGLRSNPSATTYTYNGSTVLLGRFYEKMIDDNKLIPADSNESTTTNHNIENLNLAVSRCNGAYDFIVSMEVSNSVSTEIYKAYCKFDRSSVVFQVSSVNLSSNELTF